MDQCLECEEPQPEPARVAQSPQDALLGAGADFFPGAGAKNFHGAASLTGGLLLLMIGV